MHPSWGEGGGGVPAEQMETKQENILKQQSASLHQGQEHKAKLRASSVSLLHFRRETRFVLTCLLELKNELRLFPDSDGSVSELDYTMSISHKLSELRQKLQGLDRNKIMIKALLRKCYIVKAHWNYQYSDVRKPF